MFYAFPNTNIEYIRQTTNYNIFFLPILHLPNTNQGSVHVTKTWKIKIINNLFSVLGLQKKKKCHGIAEKNRQAWILFPDSVSAAHRNKHSWIWKWYMIRKRIKLGRGTYSNAVLGDVNGLRGRRRGSGMMKSGGRSGRRRRRKTHEVVVVSESCSQVQSKASNHWSLLLLFRSLAKSNQMKWMVLCCLRLRFSLLFDGQNWIEAV